MGAMSSVRIAEISEMRKVSGTAVVMASGMSQIVEIEHCALMGLGNQWVMDVKCRPSNGSEKIFGNVLWESLTGCYPDAKVEVKHNAVTVTLPPIQESLEIAAFGTPGENDMIRKQIAIFGPKPKKEKNWLINIFLYDDTVMAFQRVREKERERGNKLLAARAGLFVANIEDDISIDLSALQPGWRIKGSEIKTIKSRDAWKMPENGTDFPCCSCEIVHVEETKESFICGITVSHGEETTKAEVVAFFKQDISTGMNVNKDSEEWQELKMFKPIRVDEQLMIEKLVGGHISGKEREKRNHEENLMTAGSAVRGTRLVNANLRMGRNLLLLLLVISCVLPLTSNGCLEAVTRNEETEATSITGGTKAGGCLCVKCWQFLVRIKQHQNVTEQEYGSKRHFFRIGKIGGVRANYKSRLLNRSYDSHRQQDLTYRCQREKNARFEARSCYFSIQQRLE